MIISWNRLNLTESLLIECSLIEMGEFKFIRKNAENIFIYTLHKKRSRQIMSALFLLRLDLKGACKKVKSRGVNLCFMYYFVLLRLFENEFFAIFA